MSILSMLSAPASSISKADHLGGAAVALALVVG